MKLADFAVEQWMNVYEGKARLNLTDTCVSPLSYQQLLAMDTEHRLADVKLDYGTITGDQRLKQQILSLYRTGTEDLITLAQGCLQANEMVMESLLEPGDRVIVFTPSYQQFSDLPRSIGCQVTALPLAEADGWQPKISELEAAFCQPIKLIVVNQPNNPTGTVLSPAYLQRMFDLARSQGTYILADEVYRMPSLTSISDQYERGISTSSLSKLYSLAGLRLGWIKGPAEIIHAINVRRDYSIISTGPLIDTLGLIALQHKDTLLNRSHAIIAANQKAVSSWLSQEPRAALVMPQAGTIGFLRYECDIASQELARGLLAKYGVFFVPGSCFGCEKHLRLGLTADAAVTAQGLQLLSRYLDQLQQKK